MSETLASCARLHSRGRLSLRGLCSGYKRVMNLPASQTASNSADTVDAAGALLRDLIDYAGLFPPASLAMAASLANYDAYSRSRWNWILGRFIVPVSRLDEFEVEFAELPASVHGTGFTSWRMSLAFASSMLDWRAPNPAGEPPSSRLK